MIFGAEVPLRDLPGCARGGHLGNYFGCCVPCSSRAFSQSRASPRFTFRGLVTGSLLPRDIILSGPVRPVSDGFWSDPESARSLSIKLPGYREILSILKCTNTSPSSQTDDAVDQPVFELDFAGARQHHGRQ